jgi:hypothetical protein
MPGFQYSTLEKDRNEIRLLTILPRGQNAPNTAQNNDGLVSCTLAVVSLNDSPPYTPLSYVWGDERYKKQILVDEFVVEITTNLEYAIRHFQQELEPVVIWADALCINQVDISEKNQQVQLMKHIYECASEVLIWLGPEDDGNDKTLNFLDKIGQQASKIHIFRLELPDLRNILSSDTKPSLFGIKESLENMVQSNIPKIPWLDLNKLFNHPWFSRVWVLQELAVSQNGAAFISCGRKKLPFQHLSASLLFFGYFRQRASLTLTIQDYEDPQRSQFWSDMNRYNSSRTARVHATRRMYQKEGNRQRESLFQMLVRTHVVYTVVDTIQSTDPRDRIFAFLGMAKEETALSFRPDYNKSIIEVFTDAAEALLNCGYFDLLTLNQDPKNESGLPSWVPDWTSYIQRPCGGFKRDDCYQACGQEEPSISFQSLPCGRKTLNIKGYTVDTITKLGEPWLPTLNDWQEWTLSHPRCSAYFASLAAFCTESDELGCNIYKHPSQRLEAPWWIPCANKARKLTAPCRPSASGAELLEGYTFIKSGRRPGAWPDVQSTHVVNYRVTMGDEFKRKPFISSQGYVGLVPSHSKPEDVICIFLGCVKPFVLRRSGSGFELIGEAYVHGIMDGEFVERKHDSEIFTVY